MGSTPTPGTPRISLTKKSHLRDFFVLRILCPAEGGAVHSAGGNRTGKGTGKLSQLLDPPAGGDLEMRNPVYSAGRVKTLKLIK